MEQKFTQLLHEEFKMRQARNATYSLRAFARDLGLGVASLSETLNEKRELSTKNFEKVLSKMQLSDAQKEILRKKYSQKDSERDAKKAAKNDDWQLLDENTFRLIADWHYLAILNLAKTKDCSSSPTQIAKRLGIGPSVVKEALVRLKKIGLLDIDEGKLVRTARPLTTSKDIPSMAIKQHHLGNLRLAQEALFEEDVDRREFGSMTMPVNPAHLKKAKELLMKTRLKIGELLDKGETSEVYTLSFQLFPLTKKMTTNLAQRNKNHDELH